MQRIARAAGVLAFVLMMGAAGLVRADEPAKPDPEAVDRILAEWQAKMSTVTAVDVRFRMKEESKGWGTTRYVGRAVLAAPNRALFERYAVDADGKAGPLTGRMIWNGRTILQFDPDQHRVLRFTPLEEWPEAPGPLRLTFFYRMTVEEAKRDDTWGLLKQTDDQIVLGAIPKAKPGQLGVADKLFLFLDRKSLLPKTLMLYPHGGERVTYEAVEIKLNPTEKLDDLFEPCLDAWTVTECGEPGPAWPIRQVGRQIQDWLDRPFKK